MWFLQCFVKIETYAVIRDEEGDTESFWAMEDILANTKLLSLKLYS